VTPIILLIDDHSTVGVESADNSSIRVHLSEGESVFASADSNALNAFFQIVAELLQSYQEREKQHVEIAVRNVPPSTVSFKINEFLWKSRPSTSAMFQSVSDSISKQRQSEEQSESIPYSIIRKIPVNRSKQTQAPVLVPIDNQRILIVKGSSSDIAMVRRLVNIYDVSSGEKERIPKIVKIRYRSANVVLQNLKQIYGARYSEDLWMDGTLSTETTPPLVHIRIDEDTNSLLINAQQADLDKISKLIFDFDSPTYSDNGVKVAILPMTGVMNSPQFSQAMVSMFGNEKSKARANAIKDGANEPKERVESANGDPAKPSDVRKEDRVDQIDPKQSSMRNAQPNLNENGTNDPSILRVLEILRQQESLRQNP
jgi:phosphoribosyl-AMP cyclohydrolase